MKKRHIILVLLCSMFSIVGLAQTYSKPNEPTFDYLTIDLTTGNPTLHWTAPSYNPQYPNPIGYIIYKRIIDQYGNDGFFEIATVDQNTFEFTDVSSDGNQSRLYYKLASQGTTEPSRLTTQHAEIWITSAYDSCNAKIDLLWNFYEGWSNIDVNQYYKLYMGNTPDWTTFQLVDSISKFTSKYSIRNVLENTDYYFYLTASRIDKPYTTYSNLYHIKTSMAIHPDYMSIDSITAATQGINVYYKIDPNTEIRNFKLVRWEQADTNQSIFSAKIIEEFSDPNQTAALDTNDSWAARTRKFYYKIDAYNGCDAVIKTTNLCNTIIPKARPNGIKVNLKWDPLIIDTLRKSDRDFDRVEYTVYRRAYTQNDDINGVGELEIAASNISETEFVDDLTPYKGQDPLYKIIFKYYIEAVERAPDNTGNTFVRSRDAIIEILPGVTMPTSIAPNSTITNNGRARNLFEPIISFDATYQLTIYNRWGSVIYHGNQAWNGQNDKGDYVKEGVYIYRLVIHTEDSGDVVKNGSLSVVYPKQ
ncbi:MAG: gliding motility-associated C-terminal domain-containing protein [Bacteroidales bacterium]